MIIGLTGTKASGKGMAAKYLVSKGFHYISLSDILRGEAVKRHKELNAETLSRLGDELREKEDWGVLAKMAIAQLGKGNYVIDGIRNPAEVEALRALPKFFLISIDADMSLRYRRIIERGRPDDPKTWEDFVRIDNEDKGLNEPLSGRRVLDTMKMADFSINHSFGPKKLHENLEKILSKIR